MKNILLLVTLLAITNISFAQQDVTISTVIPNEGLFSNNPLVVTANENVNFTVNFVSSGPTTSNSFYYYWFAEDANGTFVKSGDDYIHTYNTSVNFSIQIPSDIVGVRFDVWTENQTIYDRVTWSFFNINSTTFINSEKTKDVNIYPNPCSSNLLHINGIKFSSYKIIDITGHIVASGILENTMNTISVLNFTKGIYTIQIIKDNNLITKKILIL